MKLMTKAVEKKLLAAAKARVDSDQAVVVVKYFTPDGSGTWYISEGEKEGDDWRLFGACDLGMGSPELGYVMLSELESIRGHLKLPVERDLWLADGLTLAQCLEMHK